MKRYSTNSEINRMVVDLIREGWTPFRGKRHYRIIAPSGDRQTVPGSPGDWRTVKNFQADIKKIEKRLCDKP